MAQAEGVGYVPVQEQLEAYQRGLPASEVMGLGAFPETDPLALRMLGMHGGFAANMAVQICDLLVSVGASAVYSPLSGSYPDKFRIMRGASNFQSFFLPVG